MAQTLKFKVLQNLAHDGVRYAPGSTVEMTAEAAKILISQQVLGEIDDGKKNKGKE